MREGAGGFSGKAVGAFESRGQVRSEVRGCAGPGVRGRVVIRGVHRFCSRALLNFRLVFLLETSEVEAEAASGASSLLALALIFHCRFPLPQTFCNVHK